MKGTRYMAIGIFAMLLVGCAGFPVPKPVGYAPPVIEDYWASPTVRGGDQWRIYVKVHDPDGDLWAVQFYLDQTGGIVQNYPGKTILWSEYWNKIDGYFWMEVFRTTLSTPDPVLYMQFVDRGGRKSQSVALPIHVGRAPQQKAPDRFTDKRIYAIPFTFRDVDEAENTHGVPDSTPILKAGPVS